MELSKLTAISPIDGRYRDKVDNLAPFFSEHGLIRYRVWVEIEYYIALAEIPLPQLEQVNGAVIEKLRSLYQNFTLDDAKRVKEIEKETNHDVKAVEYFIKRKVEELGIDVNQEFIHFGLTSQDINNTAVPLSLRHAMDEVLYPAIEKLIDKIAALALEWKDIPMLARTHGQPASPTRLGKEFLVFVERLKTQVDQLKNVPYSAKFGGATGNFNAHHVTYPEIDWNKFGNMFVNGKLELHRSEITTQIEHYDNIAAFFDGFKRINTILVDFSRDIWTYISMGYFKQKLKKGEIGSSAMPHKVNPIDFENAEGNLGISTAVFEHLATKLPVSRLQRDLTDSTALRNIGVPLSHSLIAIASLEKGLGKLLVDKVAIEHDLEENWAVVAEGIQTILRREGYPKPYEALLALTRTNKKITRGEIAGFIEKLDVPSHVKEELNMITPFNYTGIKFL
jgi:adenylosuccinate lyase